MKFSNIIKKKYFLIVFASLILVISLNLCIKIKGKTIVLQQNQYMVKYQYTHYYPGDPTGSGSCTGSGKCVKDFTTDEQGWYYYNHNGQKYLVVAAATTYCRDSANHCGVNIVKHGLATTIKYYKYYDTLSLPINGKTYSAIVLDSCGACMWKRQDTRGTELIDIFVKNPSATDVIEDETEKQYSTSYGGELKEGWIYNRLKDTEEWKQFDIEIVESDIDDTIDEIFRRAKLSYEAFIENGDGDSGLEGEIIIGRTVGGPLPDYVKNALNTPLSGQTCNQSGCFGYYGASNCSAHTGVDLTSSAGATIYSAGDGVVAAVNRNSKQCQPNFTSTGAVCPPGCTGNIVTIKHTIDGETWTTKYVHMLSINSEITVGTNVTKGQAIGIIGTSGCSTGVHLHFEIIGPNNSLYNPEDLINGSCNLRSDCAQARQACKG